MPRPLRILYLHQHYSAPAGSTATRAHAHAAALAARGHDVTVACGRYAGAETGLSGPFRRDPLRGARRQGRAPGARHGVVEFDIRCGNAQGDAARALAFARFAWRATALALRTRPDLVLASSTPLTVAIPALVARRRRGVPFLFEIRDPWPELPAALGAPRPALAAMDWLADAACREAAGVIALTEGVAKLAIARGAAPGRVRVVPNGSDLDLFGPQILPWRPAEAAPWECLAVYAGAHGRANGLDVLLDAAALLIEAGERRVRIVLAGEGSERARLETRARQEGLANVSFLGPLPKTRLAGLLAGSQVALHCLAPVPEFAEWTAPNKLTAALAAGRAVITNVPGRAARIVEGEGGHGPGPAGIAVPPGDPLALARALRDMAADRARRESMGLAGRAQAVRLWDRRLHAAALCEMVEAVVGGTPAAGPVVSGVREPA